VGVLSGSAPAIGVGGDSSFLLGKNKFLIALAFLKGGTMLNLRGAFAGEGAAGSKLLVDERENEDIEEDIEEILR